MKPALPRRYVITPEPASASAADCDAFLDRLSAVLARGDTLVQLRVKSFDAATFARLAADALARCEAAGAQLMLNGPIDAQGVLQFERAGWHLDGATLRATQQRPLPAERLLSAACHDAAICGSPHARAPTSSRCRRYCRRSAIRAHRRSAGRSSARGPLTPRCRSTRSAA